MRDFQPHETPLKVPHIHRQQRTDRLLPYLSDAGSRETGLLFRHTSFGYAGPVGRLLSGIPRGARIAAGYGRCSRCRTIVQSAGLQKAGVMRSGSTIPALALAKHTRRLRPRVRPFLRQPDLPASSSRPLLRPDPASRPPWQQATRFRRLISPCRIVVNDRSAGSGLVFEPQTLRNGVLSLADGRR